MNLGLLLPAALAALAALLLPLLIHLARRSEDKRTVFSALRWLREKPKPRQRLKFDEWPLLATRLLLLALLALLLAHPVLFGGETGKHWVVATPGIATDAVADVGDGEAEQRWLAPGFPKITDAESGSNVAFSSLLRELDSQLPADTKLTVVVPEQLAAIDAQRIVLSRSVEWKIVPGALPKADATPEPLQLDLSRLPADTPGLRYLRAINTAWQTGRPERARRVPVLLASQKPAAELEFHPALRDAIGETIAETARTADGTTLRFVRELSPAAMPELLDPDFPARLREALLPAPAPSRVFARDHAPLTGATAYPQTPRDLRPWLGLLIALLFLVERWLATSRRRGVAP